VHRTPEILNGVIAGNPLPFERYFAEDKPLRLTEMAICTGSHASARRGGARVRLQRQCCRGAAVVESRSCAPSSLSGSCGPWLPHRPHFGDSARYKVGERRERSDRNR
jgi:hypothetical protein